MIRIHGTIGNGTTHQAAVVMRDGETLEDAIGRGACYILDAIGGNYLTHVWSETMNEFDFERYDPLMDGQIPGGILLERSDR